MASIEHLREVKAKLGLAWKQVHEFAEELIGSGFDVVLESSAIRLRTGDIGIEPEVKAEKNEVIKL